MPHRACLAGNLCSRAEVSYRHDFRKDMAANGGFENLPFHQIYLHSQQITEVVFKRNKLQESEWSVVKLHQEVQITLTPRRTTCARTEDTQEAYAIVFL